MNILALPKNLFKFISSCVVYWTAERESNTGFKICLQDLYPCLNDWSSGAATLPKHYFYQDNWAARKVYQSGTTHHYDIGSRVDGFVSMCTIFTHVTLIDLRILDICLPNLNFLQADCTNMHDVQSNSISSLSCLHVIEHFGLGRYGDKVDPNAYIEFIDELKRVMAPSGDLFISVPIGKHALKFNAHRIFDASDFITKFDGFEIIDFSVVDDENKLIEEIKISECNNFRYACGLFHFRKYSDA